MPPVPNTVVYGPVTLAPGETRRFSVTQRVTVARDKADAQGAGACGQCLAPGARAGTAVAQGGGLQRGE